MTIGLCHPDEHIQSDRTSGTKGNPTGHGTEVLHRIISVGITGSGTINHLGPSVCEWDNGVRRIEVSES